jgi:hypothetical protein
VVRRPGRKNDEEDDDLELHDTDEDDEGPRSRKRVWANVKFIRMWPRAIFTTPGPKQGKRGKPRSIAGSIPELEKPGVYVLYRDDQPYYVGQTKGKLRSRLRSHATNVGSVRGYFWNYFSAFVAENERQIDQIEAILIAAMPSVLSNGASPRLERHHMGKPTRDVLRKIRSTGRY